MRNLSNYWRINVHPQDSTDSTVLSAADSTNVSTDRDVSFGQDGWPHESGGSSSRPYGRCVLGQVLSLVQYPSEAWGQQRERWKRPGLALSVDHGARGLGPAADKLPRVWCISG